MGDIVLTGPGATIGKARQLRRTLSLPEVILWQQLRRRPGGHKFRSQHPTGPFVVDFVCLASRLAIEIDGEAHSRGDSPRRDFNRDEWLANQGFSTFRIPAREVLENLDGVLTAIVSRCEEVTQPLRRRSAPPPPRIGEEL